jgi:hypothetical protein
MFADIVAGNRNNAGKIGAGRERPGTGDLGNEQCELNDDLGSRVRNARGFVVSWPADARLIFDRTGRGCERARAGYVGSTPCDL